MVFNFSNATLNPLLSSEPVNTVIGSDEMKILIGEYCSGISNSLGWLSIIVLLMWILQPAIERLMIKLENNKEFGMPIKAKTIMFMYKWIGLGFLVLIAYGCFFM